MDPSFLSIKPYRPLMCLAHGYADAQSINVMSYPTIASYPFWLLDRQVMEEDIQLLTGVDILLITRLTIYQHVNSYWYAYHVNYVNQLLYLKWLHENWYEEYCSWIIQYSLPRLRTSIMSIILSMMKIYDVKILWSSWYDTRLYYRNHWSNSVWILIYSVW